MTKEELRSNLKSQEWRLNSLYWIKDKEGNRIKFKLNWAQKLLYDNIWFLNVILKVRQLGVCLDPKTKVLTSDLKWKNIEDLKVGTELISVDENHLSQGKRRRMRKGIVQGVVDVYREAYRITFDDGRSVICTAQHPWLSRKVSTEYKWRNIEGVGNGQKKSKLTVGTKIRSITKPWDSQQIYEDGWIGGMIDGEGHFSKERPEIDIAQVQGEVLDRTIKYFKDRKYNYRIEIDNRKAGEKSKLGNKPVHKVVIGRANELFRLLGTTRPSRFMKRGKWWEGKEMPTYDAWNTIVKIEKLGRKRMIDLQTSEGTYIAEGFVSHNTTFFCILYLDECLFYGKDAGLIAHTFDDAKKIFETKIRYAWDNLPEVLKAEYNLDSESVRQLKFTRGKMVSSIYVGTSLRSGTVQNLHSSELGTVDQKYPNKSEEIKTGAFNTVEKGQRITVESTAKGQVGVFADICQQGIELEKRGLPLTEMDWKFFFLPWYLHPQYQLEGNIVIPVEFKEYFTKLEIELDIKLSQKQRNWYFKKSLLQKDSMKSEYPSTPAEAFLATVEGAYYSKQMMKVMEGKRIINVSYEPSILVDTWWDIGTSKKKSDATSIIFTQDIGLEIHIIDFYGNSGEGLKHYAKILQGKPYIYGNHWAPHDIEVKELGTGKTRLEMAAKFGIRFRIVSNIGLLDGIEAVRIVLSKCWFDEEKTARLRKALLSYRKEWDDKLGKWIEHPLGDWAADPSDAFRMMAVGHQDHIKLGKYDKQEEEVERIKEREQGGFDPFEVFPSMG